MSAINQLIKEVLELDKKATKGPWVSEQWLHQDCGSPMGYWITNPPHKDGGDIVATTDLDKGIEDPFNAALIAHYRTACVKLALAAQEMLNWFEYTQKNSPVSREMLIKIQKIVEGE